MKNLAFIDIGELGWSLYLIAYLRWLKKNTDSMIIVMSFPSRNCLYEGIADTIMDIPMAFNEKYGLKTQDSHRLRRVSWDELRDFFSPYIPEGYSIPPYDEYPKQFANDKRIYAPFRYSKLPEDRKEILIFPRFRPGKRRNLPESFYSHLIKRLCDKFPGLTVKTSGTKNGAYDIKIDRHNYINWVDKENNGLQELIDSCQSAVAAIGGVSAPPKISLLQGVPTFMIGHDKKRYIQRENWMNTKVGFYEIDKRAYSTFNSRTCARAIVKFVAEA